jgi:hypothetical protein
MISEAVDKIERILGALGDDYFTPFAQQLVRRPHCNDATKYGICWAAATVGRS